MCTHGNKGTYTHTHTYTNTIPTQMHAQAHTYICTCMYKRTQKHTHTEKRMHTHTDIRKLTNKTHTHTHTLKTCQICTGKGGRQLFWQYARSYRERDTFCWLDGDGEFDPPTRTFAISCRDSEQQWTTRHSWNQGMNSKRGKQHTHKALQR